MTAASKIEAATLASAMAQDAAVAVDMAARQVARDADFLAIAPKSLVAGNRELLEDARERLNDAIARIAA